jgi:hypothetical protein
MAERSSLISKDTRNSWRKKLQLINFPTFHSKFDLVSVLLSLAKAFQGPLSETVNLSHLTILIKNR